jgi:hypothetical protein
MINFPKVFETGKIEYEQNKAGKLKACADALSAWGCCHAGTEPPRNFGDVMAEISNFLGEKILPGDLMSLTDRLLKQPIYKNDTWYMVPNLKGEMVRAKYMYYPNTNNEEFIVDGGGRLGLFQINHDLVYELDYKGETE